MKIVLSIVLALFIVGCSEETLKQAQKVEPKRVVKEVVEPKKVEVEAVEVEAPKEELMTEELSKVTEAVDGSSIYKTCIGCHGVNGEKIALGKSKVIQGWSSQKVEDALNGYVAGTYGGTMKGMMKSQASKLSPEDKKAVSKYISTL